MEQPAHPGLSIARREVGTPGSEPGRGRAGLFEAIVYDLHWTCLQVGAIANLLNAGSVPQPEVLLKSWRHVLSDDRASMALGLRFAADIGIPSDAVAKIDALYDEFTDFKACCKALVRGAPREGARQADQMRRLSGDARALCKLAASAMEAIDPLVRRQLEVRYQENGQVLATFLRATGAGKSTAVNAQGNLSLPDIAAGRSSPRLAVGKPCEISVNGATVAAVLGDLSDSGIGLICKHVLPIGSEVVVRTHDKRQIRAVVVWQRGDKAGVRIV